MVLPIGRRLRPEGPVLLCHDRRRPNPHDPDADDLLQAVLRRHSAGHGHRQVRGDPARLPSQRARQHRGAGGDQHRPVPLERHQPARGPRHRPGGRLRQAGRDLRERLQLLHQGTGLPGQPLQGNPDRGPEQRRHHAHRGAPERRFARGRHRRRRLLPGRDDHHHHRRRAHQQPPPHRRQQHPRLPSLRAGRLPQPPGLPSPPTAARSSC